MKKRILLSAILFLFLLSSSIVYAQTIPEKGTLVKTKMNCPSLENNLIGDSAERDIAIYLPPEYDNDDKVYPVIYLLGGQLMQFDAWFGEGQDLDHYLRRYGVDSYMDELINSKIIEPMIVVAPDIRSKYGSGWYTNSVASGNWEDYIVNDVVNFIDQHYRTIKSAKSRGISGWSAGGFGALKLAMKHPDVFNSVFSISPYVCNVQSMSYC